MSSSIGPLLKEARNKKTLTLDDVYSRIKIHPRVLNLLEEDKFDKLPSPLFVKSFLKTYAEFLELNPEELVHRYEAKDKKDPEQILFIKSVDEKRGRPHGKNIFSIIAPLFLLAAVGFAGFYLFKLSLRFTAERFHKKESKTISASSRPAVMQGAEWQWLRSVDQGNFPKVTVKTPLELKINALDNVWLRVTCDDKVLFQSILKRSSAESWKAQKQIEIWTGNASSMSMVLNRFDLGSPGKGVIKKMLISRQGVRIEK